MEKNSCNCFSYHFILDTEFWILNSFLPRRDLMNVSSAGMGEEKGYNESAFLAQDKGGSIGQQALHDRIFAVFRHRIYRDAQATWHHRGM